MEDNRPYFDSNGILYICIAFMLSILIIGMMTRSQREFQTNASNCGKLAKTATEYGECMNTYKVIREDEE